MEFSVSFKMDDYNFANPSTNPQVQQVQQGLDTNMITNIGTVITTSVATAMTNTNKKKTFVSEKVTFMIKLLEFKQQHTTSKTLNILSSAPTPCLNFSFQSLLL